MHWAWCVGFVLVCAACTPVSQDSFEDLLERQQQLRYGVHYLVTFDGQESEMVHYVDMRSGSIRQDTAAGGVITRTITDGDEGVSCVYSAGWTCVPAVSGALELVYQESGEVAVAPSRTVAGVNTQCFVSDDSERCFSHDGVPLFIHLFDSETVFTAQNFTLTIPRDAFMPPQ